MLRFYLECYFLVVLFINVLLSFSRLEDELYPSCVALKS